MAAADVINEAGGNLWEAVLQLRTFVDACQELEGDSKCSPWLYIVTNHAHDINKAAEAYQAAVYEHAMPHLRDLANASKPRGSNSQSSDVTKVPTIKPNSA